MAKRLFSSVLSLISILIPMNGAAQSGTVPVLYINTENGREVINKEDKVPASLYIDPGQTDYDALGSQEAPVAFTLSGRGNYTWTGFDKKPYKVKFDKKQEVMGLPKGKNFALLAHADDNMGFLRNAVGMELSRRLGLDWTPTQIPVEVVLNGKYHGLYFFTETIKVDSKRVNITEQDDLNTDPATVAGGWIVEIDNYDTDPHVEIQEGNSGYTIFFTYKSPEELSDPQLQYLTSQMQAIDDALYTSDKNSALWESLIDIDSAARFYVVQEILDDCESYHGSCYLTHDLGTDAKWKFGPVWDFGNTYQRREKSWIWDRPIFHQVWIGELYKFPRFQQKVKEVWKEFCTSVYPDMESYIDTYIDYISQAGLYNNKRWPQYGNENLTERASVFKGYFNRSVDWLASKWEYAPPRPLSVYVRGTFNNWGLSNPMNTEDGNIYTAIIPSISTSDSFKIATEDWSTVDYGAPGDGDTMFAIGEINVMEKKGANITLPENLQDVRMSFNLTEGTLLIDNEESGVNSVVASNISMEGRVMTSDTPISVFTLSGMAVACESTRIELPTSGLYIIVHEGKATKLQVK
ncbi:MAG: CotH kinase family protein [Muribaculum sp.]|nr:CotH kinase family protein [Muribaculum sp.]